MSPKVLMGKPDGKGKRVAIVASAFNRYVVDRLVDGAVKALKRAGVKDAHITVAWVPGAFEIPAAAGRMARSGRYDAVVTLGCVVKGETAHFDYVAGECARGVAALARRSPVPITFGVLACHTLDQALARSGPKTDNRGGHVALAALEMTSLMKRIVR